MAMASPDNTLQHFISTETVGPAIDALIKWLKSKAKHEKAQLLDHHEFIYLILTLKKIPTNPRTNPYKIPLPHPLHPSPLDICLIIDDRSRSGLTSESAKKKIASESIPVSKVVKLSKLRSDYRPFEAKRQLCGSYDLFFADKRVVPVLPRLLGKHFFKKKKIPIPIDLRHKNWKEQIEQVCGSAMMFLRTGTCCIFKVGRVSMEREEIMTNVVAAISGAVEVVPRKWGNVRSLHLKSLESVALPIYQSVPEMGLKIEGFKKENEVETKVENAVGVAEKKEKDSEKKKKVSKKGRIHEVRYLDSEMDALMVNVVDDDGEVKGGEAELLGNKNKNKRKKTEVTEEFNGEDLDDDIDDLMANADYGMDGGKESPKPTGKKKTKKKKKAAGMELGGEVNVDDGVDGSETSGDDTEMLGRKKHKKKKAAGMEESGGGMQKKIVAVKKGRSVEVKDGLSSSDGMKKRSKAGKLEDKGRELKKKASKKGQ